MKMKFSKLEDNNKKARKLRFEKLLKDWKDIKEVFYYQEFLYVSKVICLELINRHYNNLLVDHFEIKKMQKLIATKYY